MLAGHKNCWYVAVLAMLGLTSCTNETTHWAPLEVHVGGRTLTSSDEPQRHTYSWPGVYFEARFTGPTVRVEVDDAENALHLLVDGELQLVLPRTGRRTLVLDNLGPGEHTVRLEKVSETQGPVGSFLGFAVPDAGAALAPPVYERLIEFIGDSNTVGYGNTSTGRECTSEQVRDTTNSSLTFAPLIARNFGADYRMIASSGFGVVRNYAGNSPDLAIPVLYDRILHDQPIAELPAQPAADLIVIRLGSNDFSTPLGEDEAWPDKDAVRADYRDTYVEFVERLQRDQSPAHFLLVTDSLFDDDLKAVQSELAQRVISHV